MSNVLTVEALNIGLKAEERNIVKNISFSIKGKESLVILGQSGSGKTMTCHAIMGLLDSKKFKLSGKIMYENKNLLSLPIKSRRLLYGNEIAFVPQNPMTALDPSMKIGKQMLETLCIHTKDSKKVGKEKVIHALQEAGLEEITRVYNSYPFELSGGMLQRVLVAMVLMMKAKVVIADEPTTALDVVHRNEIMEALTALKEKGAAILMVTHDFAAAMQLGERMIIMHEGSIVEQGNAKQILYFPRHAYTKQLIEASVLSTNMKEGMHHARDRGFI